MKKTIVFVDSGAGGLHILKGCENLGLCFDCVYLADNLNGPYGALSRRKLLKISYNLVQNAIKNYNPKIIVFACNTLTVNAIKYVRKKFPSVFFIGVEPALKKAKIFGGTTIILSTPATEKKCAKLGKKVVKSLKNEYKSQGLKFSNDDKFSVVPLKNLAHEIDENLENLDALMPSLKRIFSSSQFSSCENLVLGCTHYIALKKQIIMCLKNVQIFDGLDGICGRISYIVKKLNIKQQDKIKIKFVLTKKDENFKNKLKKYYKKIKI